MSCYLHLLILMIYWTVKWCQDGPVCPGEYHQSQAVAGSGYLIQRELSTPMILRYHSVERRVASR